MSEPGADLADLRIDCTRTLLDNGLVVIVHEDPSAPEVSLSVCYRVGSKDEGPGSTGSAHLFEHLMFTGSANLPGMFGTALTTAGVTMINAYTTPDYTCFFETFPPGVLAFALYAEADRMGSFRDQLTDEAVAQQRRIVLEEKAQRAGGTLGTLPEIVRANLYPVGHPYHHPVIGSKQDIEGMTLARAREWHARYYTPDNAVVLIGGPVERGAAVALVRAHFAHIAPSGRGAMSHRWIPAPSIRRQVRIEAPVAHGGMIQLVWPVAEASSPDIFCLELAASLLAGDDTSPLHRALVRAGECLGLSATVSSGQVCSEFSLNLTLDAGADHGRMATRARAALQDALSRALDEAAFDRVRSRERTRLALSLDHLATSVGVLMNGEMLWRDPLHYLVEISAIEAMSADALRLLARRWLDSEPMVVEIHPQTAAPFVPAETARAGRPAIEQDRRVSASPDYVRTDHPSGLRTIDVPRIGARDFVLRLDLAHGADSEEPAQRGIGSLIATMPQHGIGLLDPVALRELTDRLGLTIHLGSAPSAFVIELHGPASAAETAAALLGDLVLAPQFNDDILIERKREQANRLRAVQPDAMAHFASLAPALLYGDDSADACDPGGTTASIAAISGDSLIAYHRRLFDPAGATLFAAGTDETLQRLHDRLASLRLLWSRPADPLPAPALAPLPQRRQNRIHFVAAGPDDQAIMTMAMLLPVPTSVTDEAAARALGFILERRLGARLRDQLHWTYGVSARPVEPSRPDLPPRLEIGGAVNADQVAEVMAEIEAGIAGLADATPPTLAEVDAYWAAARAGITGSLVTTGGRLAAVAMALRPDRPADIRARLDALEQIDPDRIALVARAARTLGPAEWVVASSAAGVADRLGATGMPVIPWCPS